MKILAYVHGYFPSLTAGAEAMLHEILLDLRSRGHQVRVLLSRPEVSSYEDIKLHKIKGLADLKLAEWSDVIITHLNKTGAAVKLAEKARRPLIHLVHNDYQLESWNIKDKSDAALVVANSQWIKDTISDSLDSIILYPPTLPERYMVEASGEAILLVNMCEQKGGHMFWKLAEAFPDKKFIGVKGGYGSPIIPDNILPNVTVLDKTTDMKSIYAQARIVIMPSYYESWGRVAIEAACSGIPVIASTTPGLKESLSYAGIFADANSVDEWIKAIKFLDDEDNYKEYSQLSEKRSLELAEIFKGQMETFEKKIIELVR